MDYSMFLCWLLFGAFVVGGEASTIGDRNKRSPANPQELFARFVPCGLTGDVVCFLDTAESVLEAQKNDVLALADLEYQKTASARADSSAVQENSPSQLAKLIQSIVSELSDLFKDGLSGLFKSREGDDDDKIDDDKSHVGEARKKKKGKIAKLIGLIKLAIIGIVLAIKFVLLLKALSAALQVKFFLVALAGLILNAVRFYLDLKKGKEPQKVIYYEHAQHQHHYEGGEEDWSSSGPGNSYWGRSYDEEEEKNKAHNLAYSKQAAYYPKEEANSNSWF